MFNIAPSQRKPVDVCPPKEVIDAPEVSDLQEKFEMRKDADGIRDVLVIGNERPKGCPFKCVGCGVHEEAAVVDASANARIIAEQIKALEVQMKEKAKDYQESGYHLCIYNYGNVTNPEELSEANLEALLHGMNALDPAPKFVSINSRGRYVNEEVLARLEKMNLQYRIHFILGVETLSEKGKAIYGKPNIDRELANMFDVLNAHNEKNNTAFGIDTGFVFLPEFYTDDRTDRTTISEGFMKDIGGTIEKYGGQKTPLKINIHPFYEIPGMPYSSTAEHFDILMETLLKLEAETKQKNVSLPETLRTTFFIGLNDTGYETPEWEKAKAKWQTDIDRINLGQ